MAKTFVPFTPGPSGPFSFQATLDNAPYSLTVLWNAFAARWYIQCVSAANVLIFTLPLIGSPDSGDINLLGGYFIVNTLVFRVSTQTFEVGP